jgi:hypothetical protein
MTAMKPRTGQASWPVSSTGRVSAQRWHVLGERHRPLLKPKTPYGALVPRLICPEPSSLRSSQVPLWVLDHLTMGTNQVRLPIGSSIRSWRRRAAPTVPGLC